MYLENLFSDYFLLYSMVAMLIVLQLLPVCATTVNICTTSSTSNLRSLVYKAVSNFVSHKWRVSILFCLDVVVKLMRSMETIPLKLDNMEESLVIDVKEMLQKRWNILPRDQILVHNGIKLPDEYKLSVCGVVEESELELVVSKNCESTHVCLYNILYKMKYW